MYAIIYDESTFGITEKSLKMLRNTLAERIDHRVAVVEVPTDQICCGFLVLDKDAQEAIFTGDGFRTDNGGEGGAGYKSAKALLDVFGMPSIYWVAALDIWNAVASEEIPREMGNVRHVTKALTLLVDEIQGSLKAEYYVKPADRTPAYLR